MNLSNDTKSKTSNENKKLESVMGDEMRDGKVLLKPADQLQLSEAELKVEHERILNAKNPYAPDNIVRFNFNQNEFVKDMHVDQFATHFQLRGETVKKLQRLLSLICHIQKFRKNFIQNSRGHRCSARVTLAPELWTSA